MPVYSRLYKPANLIDLEPLKEAQMELVDKSLEEKKTTNIPLSMELKTAKFMNGI
ncbi:hypothetical protein BB561_002588 [Smittium simulii]|uniref:Uncharacterized protein n=1 Tax=Smittium simulii TaxID=133385 RepID=A0A2T9YPW8_9FUNG|nr:hypothetical protein BB561_002588 [Smittium simulii]